MKWFFAVFFSFSLIFLAVFGVNCVYNYIFPQKYAQEIKQASEMFDVDEAIIYSVINTESRFKKNAVSSKGAVGLMQVMPTTASEVSAQISLKEFDLKNPQDNILIGTFYISGLLKRFENLETALAAYNAGPANVSKWLQNAEYTDDGISIKAIPFEETRNYIQKFKQNFSYYSKKV